MWVKLSPPIASDTNVMNFVPPSKKFGRPVICGTKINKTYFEITKKPGSNLVFETFKNIVMIVN